MGFSNNLIREISIQMPIKNSSDSTSYDVPVAYNSKDSRPGVRVHVDYVPGKTCPVLVRKSEERVPTCLSSHLTGLARDYANSARLTTQRVAVSNATKKAREFFIRKYLGDKNV